MAETPAEEPAETVAAAPAKPARRTKKVAVPVEAAPAEEPSVAPEPEPELVAAAAAPARRSRTTKVKAEASS